MNEVKRNLLIGIIMKRAPELIDKTDILDSLNAEEYNYIREILCDELIEKGFEIDDSVNEYGGQIETLIDDIGSFFLK